MAITKRWTLKGSLMPGALDAPLIAASIRTRYPTQDHTPELSSSPQQCAGTNQSLLGLPIRETPASSRFLPLGPELGNPELLVVTSRPTGPKHPIKLHPPPPIPHTHTVMHQVSTVSAILMNCKSKILNCTGFIRERTRHGAGISSVSSRPALFSTQFVFRSPSALDTRAPGLAELRHTHTTHTHCHAPSFDSSLLTWKCYK